jgi:hypothetical protein
LKGIITGAWSKFTSSSPFSKPLYPPTFKLSNSSIAAATSTHVGLVDVSVERAVHATNMQIEKMAS